ncbi:hypothetical protein JR316_0007830 [Psilocybe cubensis]|uniref:Uncharacterized protein n=2 Tax=Psilocybe cubensis TaxID=181762 RepID=A0ACB8GUX9_PSICU|nr:hypothetical protein JR316_0007830 [Psilocybe cubensis]KAH9479242.1 hypothetical protein JR316_0007830 [Psilocybe cubensis]
MQAETTFFNHASNVVVNGGSFSAVSKQLHTHLGSSALQNNYIPPGKIGKDDVLAILHNHSALAGLLDAKERFDAPKCDPSTRIGIIKKLTNWVESESQSLPSSLLWLHGPAGVGKSALMQQLGLIMQEKGNHAASFFFSRTAVGRSDGNSLIVTLAYQLAMNFPPIRAHIASNLNKNPGIFSLSNKVKMQLLVVDPIDKLCATSFWKPFIREHFSRLQIPRLVIVDGLDECDNQDIQSDILLLVAHAISKLRLPLRFIIASRPEAHLLSSFNNSIFDKILYRLNLGADAKEFKEIRLNHPLGRHLPDPWPTTAQISTLVMKSSGGFVYPATVLKYIKSPYLRPDECLKVILGLSSTPSSDCPYAQLDDLYSHIFNSAHEAHKTSVKLIFSVLAVPSTQQYSKTIISPALLNT